MVLKFCFEKNSRLILKRINFEIQFEFLNMMIYSVFINNHKFHLLQTTDLENNG